MLSTSARIRVRTSSFLQAPTRHKSEAKLRSMQGAAHTSYRPDTLSRLHTNIEMHDWRSMSRSLTRASRAPQARCRQSILRRRRPRTCGRRCRAPRSWPPSAKRRSKKLSPATTTSLETPVWAMPLRAPHGGKSDNVRTPHRTSPKPIITRLNCLLDSHRVLQCGVRLQCSCLSAGGLRPDPLPGSHANPCRLAHHG